MGAWFVNYQVKCDLQADVVKRVEKLSSGKCYDVLIVCRIGNVRNNRDE
jgi:hypothetical protein